LPADNLDRPRVDVITKDPLDPGTNNPSLLLGSAEQGLGTISPALDDVPQKRRVAFKLGNSFIKLGVMFWRHSGAKLRKFGSGQYIAKSHRPLR